MESVLINIKKTDLNLFLNLIQKLGMKATTLSVTEIEDWKFAQKIEGGMKSSNVKRKKILKVLKK